MDTLYRHQNHSRAHSAAILNYHLLTSHWALAEVVLLISGDGKVMGLSWVLCACRPGQVKLSCLPPRQNRILNGFTSLAGTLYLVEGIGMCLMDSSMVRGVERAHGRRSAEFLKGEASLGVSYTRKCALSYVRDRASSKRLFHLRFLMISLYIN